MDTHEALVGILARSDAPLPLSTLGTRVRKAGVRLTNDGLGDELDRLAREGRVFPHPTSARGRKPSPRYWHRSAADFVRGALSEALPRQVEWTPSQLKRLVPKAYHGLLDEEVGALIAAGRLFEGPPKGKTRRLQTEPPRPTQALTATQVKSLRSVLTRINTVRRPALSLEELVAVLDGSAPAAPAGKASGTAPELDESLLRRLYDQDLPRRQGLRSMPIAWTWERYASLCAAGSATPSLSQFHALLRRLHAESRVALAVHDSGASIPESERAVLPTREDNRPYYYWTPVDPR
jgi:hypothetical protein